MKFKLKNDKENILISDEKKKRKIEKKEKSIKVNFYTLGCRTNTYETFAMMADLEKNGFQIVKWKDKADFSVINSCSVTNMSERKTRQVISKERKENPNGTIVCVGCYSQHAKKGEINADIVLGNNEKINISEYLKKYMNENSLKFEDKEFFVSDIFEDKKYREYSYNANYIESFRSRAVIKIQDGCDRFCAYCIIPYLRGRVRSRHEENILEEIKQVVKNGAKEIVLTGIHMSSYGKDFKDSTTHSLIELLEKINEIDGVERIRIGSLEPRIITDEFISRIKKLDKLCMQFHLSLQSACDETLKRMRRRYTIEEYIKAVESLRNNIFDVRITTDVMVGFPGETNEEFEETYNNLVKLNLFKMHVFKYSIREGTLAAKMKDQIDGNIKNERSNRLLELNHKNAIGYFEKDLGRELEVLIEQEKDGIYFGYTKNYTKIGIKEDEKIKKMKDKNILNEIIKVRALSIENKNHKDTAEIYLLSEILQNF